MQVAVEQKRELRIMDVVEGDIKLEWDEDNKDEVKAAKKAFHAAKKRGTMFYKMKRGGERGQAIQEFDPKAERIVGVPALRGG